MRSFFCTIVSFVLLTFSTSIFADEIKETSTLPSPSPDVESDKKETEGKEVKEKKVKKKLPPGWRCDPTIKRRPGSYFAIGLAYNQGRAWFSPKQDEFSDSVFVGPVHARQTSIRVGDAFAEWFAVGFQIDIVRSFSNQDNGSMTGFGLLLDTTFYPWRGLGIRPSVGLGFSYATGEYDYETGFGGPLDLSLGFVYEIRLNKLLTIAPMAQVYWIKGDEFNSLFFTFGIELSKWFATATG